MSEGNGNNFVRVNWPILTVIAGGLIAWGSNTAYLRANETETRSVKDRVAQVEKDISEIKQSIARVETNQERDTQEAARMRASLEQLLQELRRLQE